MNALDVLDQLEATSGQNDKVAILSANLKNKALEELLDAAMNFDRKYYLKKFGDCAGVSEPNYGPGHAKFMQLLKKLEDRDVTGHAAIAEVEDFMLSCMEQQRKWYPRVIRKDLKCNFGVSLANKAGFNLHEFEVMLAKDGKECKKLADIVSKGVHASPKFNGYRVLAICDNGVVTLHSRNGLEYENFPSVVATLEKLCQNSSFILDGECMSDDFNKMQQTAMSSKSGKTVGDIKYHVFGWVPVNEWATKDFKMLTDKRLENLATWFGANKAVLDQDKNVVMVDHKLLYTVADALQFEKDCILQRFEGAMLMPNIPYYLGKKSNKLLKLKTFVSMECEILSLYYGEAGKGLEHTMGGVTVRQENGKECNVGSGWSLADRDYMIAHPDQFIGRTIEVQYQEMHHTGIIQFGTYQRFRNDK